MDIIYSWNVFKFNPNQFFRFRKNGLIPVSVFFYITKLVFKFNFYYYVARFRAKVSKQWIFYMKTSSYRKIKQVEIAFEIAFRETFSEKIRD